MKLDSVNPIWSGGMTLDVNNILNIFKANATKLGDFI